MYSETFACFSDFQNFTLKIVGIQIYLGDCLALFEI